MRPESDRTRILFVDDEPNIRLTLPHILRQHGFEVTSVASVSQALREISAQEFDALISDLNIGEPGDGFTVVSAMRRTQPQCLTFILTGYPAFETALQAIRSQVDDYLVKPADVHDLINTLRHRLTAPRQIRWTETLSLAEFLSTYAREIGDRSLASMRGHPRIGALPLNDAERVENIPSLLAEIARQLRSEKSEDLTEKMLWVGFKHGQARRQQGYSQEMLVDDTRIVDSSTYAVVQDHLLEISLSNLIPDLSRFNDGLEAHLQASLRAFSSEKAA